MHADLQDALRGVLLVAGRSALTHATGTVAGLMKIVDVEVVGGRFALSLCSLENSDEQTYIIVVDSVQSMI